MRTIILIAAVLTAGPAFGRHVVGPMLVLPQSADPPRSAFLAKTGGAIAGELAVVVTTTLGIYALGEANNVSWADESSMGYGVLWVGATAIAIPAGCASGARIVGKHNGQNGRFWAAYLGGLVGIPVGLGFAAMGGMTNGVSLIISIPLYAAGVVSPAVGSVIGYNLSRTPVPASFWSERMEPPAMSMLSVSDESGTTHTAFDFRLVTVRF